jgi:hypothetical protein
MAVSAMARDGICGWPVGAEAFYHKVEAIRLINKRIAEARGKGGDVGDSVIRAVNLLWALSVCTLHLFAGTCDIYVSL